MRGTPPGAPAGCRACARTRNSTERPAGTRSLTFSSRKRAAVRHGAPCHEAPHLSPCVCAGGGGGGGSAGQGTAEDSMHELMQRPGVVIGGGGQVGSRVARGHRGGGGGGMHHSRSTGEMGAAAHGHHHGGHGHHGHHERGFGGADLAEPPPSQVTFSAEDFPQVGTRGSKRSRFAPRASASVAGERGGWGKRPNHHCGFTSPPPHTRRCRAPAPGCCP